MAKWRFYGRSAQLIDLEKILRRGRWFFAQMTGRRRIGKTALIQHALPRQGRPVFYVQIPDSSAAGVLSAVNDALETFAVPAAKHPRPHSLGDLALLIEHLAEDGYVCVLDEFQYFSRRGFEEFCSRLQDVADRLAAKADRVPGGLLVLGSIHTEMMALLENRAAPLYSRCTDKLELTHLDVASVRAILKEHADARPDRLLFLWTLFEGVPKFYRDAFEQEVLGADRPALLRRLFFESSSPLRTEADNWFLHELRGHYDVALKFVARHPGRAHHDLMQAIRDASGDQTATIGGHLAILGERYRLIERKLPIFAKPDARRGRYYLTDNFLRAWLAALASPVAAVAFRPLDRLVAEADRRLADCEGAALEKLVGQLYEERSRGGIGDFPLGERIQGYWDKAGTELDLVALNEDEKRVRLASIKRDPDRLLENIANLKGHAERFLEASPRLRGWKAELVGVSVRLDAARRRVLSRNGVLPQDLDDLTQGM